MATLHHALEHRISLTLNAQLQQTLHILSLDTCALRDLIQDHCERNPFLDYEDTYTVSSHQPSGGGYGGQESELNWLENKAYQPSAKQWVAEQIQQCSLTIQQRAIAYTLWDHLNDQGYMKTPLSIVAWGLSVSMEEVFEVLKVLQTLEPVGIFARNLGECLLLQLEDQGLRSELTEEIVRALCAVSPQKALKRSQRQSMSADAWKQACWIVQRLAAHPLELYQDHEAKVMIPDLILTVDQERWHLEVNERWMPRVHAQEDLYQSFRQRALGDQESAYVKEHWAGAQNLVQCIRQRRTMMLRVCGAILKAQEGFIQKGKEGLKPLILQDIADELGVHISTVSRAIQGKVIQTSYGVFPLKFFFRTGLMPHHGEATAPYIQEKIRSFVRQEPSHKPLSDQDLAHMLQQLGMKIARRTVQKYREAIRIPSAMARRQAWSA